MTQITYFQNVWCSNLCFCIVIFLQFKKISNFNDAIWLSAIFTYMYFPSCFFLSQRTFLYSKHHTYDKILWFTIFLFLFSRLRLQRRIIKKNGCWPFWPYYRHFGQYQFIVCFCVFFIHALLKKQNKNFAELNYCDFYFIVFPFDALENK